MPTTPVYALRYPAATDPADVPTDMGELATDVESALSMKAPGTELAWAEITAPVTIPISAEAAAATVVTAPAITLDGSTKVIVEFFTQALNAGAAINATTIVNLWDGSTNLGMWGQTQNVAAGSLIVPAMLHRRLTPSSGSHTFIAKAWSTVAAGAVNAGPGGAGQIAPTFIRVIRA